jgi:hypothetical protein
MPSSDFVGSIYAFDEYGDDDDAADDILFEGDPDFDREKDYELMAAGEFGKARKRKARRKAKRAKKLDTVLLPIAQVASAAAAPVQMVVAPDRDCRLLDLRLVATTPVTGVVDPGFVLNSIQVGGNNLLNAAGPITVANLDPHDRRPGCYNCNIQKLVRAAQNITILCANTTAATALLAEGSLLVRARVA